MINLITLRRVKREMERLTIAIVRLEDATDKKRIHAADEATRFPAVERLKMGKYIRKHYEEYACTGKYAAAVTRASLDLTFMLRDLRAGK